MNLKRIGTLLLAAAMSASFMAGCGDQPAQSSGSQPESSKSESSAAQSETSGFSYPTTGSLTFWQWANGNVGANFASFEDTPAAGYAEEATGVKVDYIDDHSNTDEAFQLMTTSDKLPDLIGHGWLGYNGGIVAAYEDGLCIRLNEVIDQYMPNFKALLDANPDVKKMASDDEGNIYFIPLVGAYSSLYTYGSYVRTDMLEKVGGQVPSTIDGWHNLLTAVKNEYGIAPFTTTWGDLLTMSFVSYAYGVGNTEYVVGSDGAPSTTVPATTTRRSWRPCTSGSRRASWTRTSPPSLGRTPGPRSSTAKPSFPAAGWAPACSLWSRPATNGASWPLRLPLSARARPRITPTPTGGSAARAWSSPRTAKMWSWPPAGWTTSSPRKGFCCSTTAKRA